MESEQMEWKRADQKPAELENRGREGCFLFLWAMGYQLVGFLARGVRISAPLGQVFLLSVYLALLFGWCIGTGRAKAFRLTFPVGLSRRQWLSLWPLLVFPDWNLCHGGLSGWNFLEAFPLAAAAVAEELFFRGALPALASKRHQEEITVLSALLFAAYHWFSPDRSWGQLWCCFSAGICYGVVTLRTGSLFPAILAHLAVNFTGAGAQASPSLWLWALLILIWGIYCLIERKREISCSFT